MIMTRYATTLKLFCLYLHGFLNQYSVTYNSNRTATELRSIEIANTVNMVSAIQFLAIGLRTHFANHCKLH